MAWKKSEPMEERIDRLSTGREAAALNEVWMVDFKGWWRNGDKRCEPLTVRDEYSRYLLEVRAVEDGRSETVRKSFERIFERHGLPEAIRSDNGSPFASRDRKSTRLNSSHLGI